MMKHWLPLLLSGVAAVAQAQDLREAPPSGQFCRGKERVEYTITAGDVELKHGKKTYSGPTAYSYFGREKPPKGFVVGFVLGQPGDDALLFDDRLQWHGNAWKPCPATPAH
jgi:hypothetical protein